MKGLEPIKVIPGETINIVEVTTREVLEELIKKSQSELPFSLEVKHLKELLPHGETKIYLLLEQGKIPGRKIGGKWVIPRDQFLAWYYTGALDL